VAAGHLRSNCAHHDSRNCFSSLSKWYDNMTNPRTLASCCCFALLLLGGSTASAAVTITGGQAYASVHRKANDLFDYDSIYGTADATATASLVGFLSTAERITSGATITYDLEQFREGGNTDIAYGYIYTDFVVDVDTAYAISGRFTNSAGTTYMQTVLQKLSGGQIAFYHAMANVSDGLFSAEVGGTDANQGYYREGSANGVLLAGHQYRLYTTAYTQAYPNADDSATASGSFTLQFGDPDVEIVPEPASIAVWSCLSLGAVGTTWVRKRRVSSTRR
jgi:hypothetical protein